MKRFSGRIARPVRRVVGLTVAGLVALAGCVAYRWQPTPITDVSLAEAKLQSREIRISTDMGVVGMRVEGLAFPYVLGSVTQAGGVVQIDMSDARSVERVEFDFRGRVTTSVPMDLEAVRRNPEGLLGEAVRIQPGAMVLRPVGAVEGPYVGGVLVSGSGRIRVDLRGAHALEVREVDGPMTVLRVIGITSAIVAGTILLVALTKESCPFVYVDRGDGWELVGEAYAGAAFRSTQRDDLLPLPELGGNQVVRVRLRNEARETQYTDQAKLVVVDHSPGVRALSTFDNRLVLVGGSVSPLAAWDGRGADKTVLVAGRDDRLWETDPHLIAVAPDDELEDVLVVEFAAPASGTPVLELVAGNTAWLDLIFGRFFAALGDRLHDYLEQGNEPAAGPRIQAWRQRQGVDLIVELETRDGWKPVGVIPTVGPAALREIAVPLPTNGSVSDGLVRVRLRAGLGFWRIDRLALSTEAATDTIVHRVEATSAVDWHGADQRETILAVDNRYNVLLEMNETLDTSFELPPLAPDLARSAFLFTNGYYNVHLPIQARWQPGVLRPIRDEAGALPRFGRDLARKYVERLNAAPAPHFTRTEGGR